MKTQILDSCGVKEFNKKSVLKSYVWAPVWVLILLFPYQTLKVLNLLGELSEQDLKSEWCTHI